MQHLGKTRAQTEANNLNYFQIYLAVIGIKSKFEATNCETLLK